MSEASNIPKKQIIKFLFFCSTRGLFFNFSVSCLAVERNLYVSGYWPGCQKILKLLIKSKKVSSNYASSFMFKSSFDKNIIFYDWDQFWNLNSSEFDWILDDENIFWFFFENFPLTHVNARTRSCFFNSIDQKNLCICAYTIIFWTIKFSKNQIFPTLAKNKA